MFNEQAVTFQPMANQWQTVIVGENSVTVRTMTASDCDFAGRMLVNAFQGKFIHAIGTGNLELARQASAEDHRLNAANYHRIFIAELNGERAGLLELDFNGERKPAESNAWERLSCWPLCRLGCMGAFLKQDVPRGKCYVDHICVDERFRGKGVGKVLLDKADEQARQSRCQEIFLWVASDNRAVNLYSRHGYRVTESSTLCCMARCIFGRSKFKKMEKRL